MLDARELFSLAQAAKLLPGRPHISTLHRWRLKGVKGVKLDTVVVGGRRFVTREALERFVQATTAAANGFPLPTRTPRQRERDIADAEREFDRE